ncbi:MAG: cobalt-precorrin 5A hydrolase [Bacteroides sp.]|nr:cobalt-precorrin 5A hydrolase [Eubacterium sp.]MCM1417863.1 cobalt-precorrin 5A hydrolase [Roseburia sp.]MCM1461302.1 cobalt-precorrin 5A hydrolase [Bacteroides sp.]
MRIAIISVTERGRLLSEKIGIALAEDHAVKKYCFYKYSDGSSEPFSDVHAVAEKAFSSAEGLIFVCSCGIAVRAIAPLVRSKTSDPAVVVADERGKYMIPLLSGHLGGANRLAQVVAKRLGAVAVLTTATDAGGRFSPDLFAAANGLIIADLKAAKEIAAAVLNDQKIGFLSDYPFVRLPPELTSEPSEAGIVVSANAARKPFALTLNLVPKNIVVGIGCKKNTPAEVIRDRVGEAFSRAGIDPARIGAAATIDLKAGEKGLIGFCKKAGIALTAYPAEVLMSVEGDFKSSDFVKARTGADNVCERSAVLRSGGTLVIPKTTGSGVTVAAAEIPLTLDFERKIF